MKFSTKLILSVIAAALIIMLVFGFAVFFYTRDIVKNKIINEHLQLARHQIDNIDRVLYNAYQDIQLFGEDKFLGQLFESEQPLGQNARENVIREIEKRTILTGPWELLTVVNKEGFIVFSLQKEDVGKNVREYPKTHAALYPALKGQLYYSDCVLSGQMGRQTIIFSAPIRNEESSRVIGAVIGYFAWPAIEEILDQIKPPSYAHLLNKDGLLIATSVINKTETFSMKFTGHSFAKKALSVESRDQGTIATMVEEDVEVLAIYVKEEGYLGYRGSGWGLLVETPTSAVFAPINRMAINIVILAAIVMVILVISFNLIGKIVTRPIESLSKTVKLFGDGDLSARVEVKTRDEIGNLAASFNDMACKLEESRFELKRSYIQLEEKVEERTTELSLVNTELEGEVEQRTAAQNVLEERIKELKCLFDLSKLVEQPEISLEQIFHETVYLIRSAYRYPDVTCARITFNGCKYETDNFKKTELSQYAPINVARVKAGAIEVFYIGEEAESDESPFLSEERDMLDTVAEHLGRIAERKKTGDKLQLFRNLIDQSNDCIFLIEPQWGRFLDVNDRTCASLGYTREELLTMTLKDVDESIPDDSVWQQKAEELKLKTDLVIEGRHKRKDATTFYAETSLKYVSQGKEDYIIAVARDITERKRAEEALKKSEERLRVALSAAQMGTWWWDPSTNQDTRDASFNGILGLEAVESTQTVDDFLQRVHPEDRDMVDAEIQRSLREHCTYLAEFRIVRPDSTVRWLSDQGKPIYDQNDHILYLTGAVVDITERKQAEEKLKQAAEEWITTFGSISDLVSIHDKDFKLIRVNKAFADAFKAKPEELIGKVCYEIVHGTKEPPAVCPHKQTLDTKKPRRAEFFEPHLGIYVEASTSPIFDEKGEVIRTVHIVKDITQRKQADERQAELLKEVESVNKELKDFAYVVSHDLKAPLRGIKTLADWMVTDYADKLDEDGREQVNLISSRVSRMHNLIDGVLQYSRIGRVKEKHIKINLNELVPEVIDTIVPPENIEITVEDKLPVVELEETRIIQVFQNLLSNAVKYMDKPQGRITIGCVRENGFWKFSVNDNGPGIEEAHYEKIFQIFQTLSPRDEVESTGVGLSVVKKIVEMYGGKIWVESKPGEGSTFFFTLPGQESEVVDNAKLEANIAR
jgi:two-component system sensor kinase FixL